jgi:TPR repeat protein
MYDEIVDQAAMAEHSYNEAQNGNSYGMFQSGLRLFLGDGIPMRKLRAVQYIKMSADRSDSSSLFHYGLLLDCAEAAETETETETDADDTCRMSN